ncbi:MAG TPA: hypothetical protein VJ001_00040, partial [Rhodocyclaceae bacterium]|nr:hypothetical protein [Rhodocyclaceae bacterium]
MNDFEGIDLAAHLNAECHCISLDAVRLHTELERVSPGFHAEVMEGRPHLFADVTVFVSATHARQMAELVSAIDAVVELPPYRQHVLSYAPELARHPTAMRGAFLGYDFHLSDEAPQLIEINTNAGGGLLNALVARAHRICCDQVHTATTGRTVETIDTESLFLDMFENEWRLFQEAKQAPPRRLRTVAIVDELPETQFLYPEFILFRRLFEHAGIRAIVCAPHELNFHEGALWHNDCEQAIDLVYNRLTDFALEGLELSPLRNAWLADAAAITPHPYAHALYADKRNLVALTDDALL